MPTLSIRLTPQESARVSRVARKRKVSRSQVVREALARLEEPGPRSLLHDWADAVGIIKGGPRDLSTNPRHMKGFGR